MATVLNILRPVFAMILRLHGRSAFSWCQFGPNKIYMNKRIGKAILATIIALSIAILPATAGFAAASKAVQTSLSATVPDCDHHRSLPSAPTPKSRDGCDSMAGCALKCFTTTVVGFSSVAVITSASTALEHSRASDQIASSIGSPPFRPPRS